MKFSFSAYFSLFESKMEFDLLLKKKSILESKQFVEDKYNPSSRLYIIRDKIKAFTIYFPFIIFPYYSTIFNIVKFTFIFVYFLYKIVLFTLRFFFYFFYIILQSIVFIDNFKKLFILLARLVFINLKLFFFLFFSFFGFIFLCIRTLVFIFYKRFFGFLRFLFIIERYFLNFFWKIYWLFFFDFFFLYHFYNYTVYLLFRYLIFCIFKVVLPFYFLINVFICLFLCVFFCILFGFSIFFHYFFVFFCFGLLYVFSFYYPCKNFLDKLYIKFVLVPFEFILSIVLVNLNRLLKFCFSFFCIRSFYLRTISFSVIYLFLLKIYLFFLTLFVFVIKIVFVSVRFFIKFISSLDYSRYVYAVITRNKPFLHRNVLFYRFFLVKTQYFCYILVGFYLLYINSLFFFEPLGYAELSSFKKIDFYEFTDIGLDPKFWIGAVRNFLYFYLMVVFYTFAKPLFLERFVFEIFPEFFYICFHRWYYALFLIVCFYKFHFFINHPETYAYFYTDVKIIHYDGFVYYYEGKIPVVNLDFNDIYSALLKVHVSPIPRPVIYSYLYYPCPATKWYHLISGCHCGLSSIFRDQVHYLYFPGYNFFLEFSEPAFLTYLFQCGGMSSKFLVAGEFLPSVKLINSASYNMILDSDYYIPGSKNANRSQYSFKQLYRMNGYRQIPKGFGFN